MVTYTPSRNYPHVGGDRIAADQLNRDLEFNPGPLPPVNPNSALGAGQFKYWVDTTDVVAPVLRQCIAPRASAGVYVPSEWLTLGTIDVTSSKFMFSSSVGFAAGITLADATVSGDLAVTGDLTTAGGVIASTATISGALTTGSASVTGDLTAGSATISGALTANSATIAGGLTVATLTVTNLNVTAAIDAGQYLLDHHVFADGSPTSIVLYDPVGTPRLTIYSTGTSYYINDNHEFQNNGGTPTLTVDASGNVSANGFVAATGAVTGASLSITGNADVGGHVNGVSLQINGLNFAANAGPQQAIYDTGGLANLTQYSSGDNYYDNNRHTFRSRGGGAVTFAQFDGTGSYNASGSWTVISDDSLKTGVAPYQTGLAALLTLNPVSYIYTSPATFSTKDAPVTRYGLMASEVESVIPEMVVHADIGLTAPVATLTPTHLTWVLINAVKELAARVTALEAP